MQIEVLPEKIGVLGTLWKDKQQQKWRHCRNTILRPFPRHAEGKQVKGGSGGDWYLQAMWRDEEAFASVWNQDNEDFLDHVPAPRGCLRRKLEHPLPTYSSKPLFQACYYSGITQFIHLLSLCSHKRPVFHVDLCLRLKSIITAG